MTDPTLYGDHPLARAFDALAPEDVMDAVERAGGRCTGRYLVMNSYENRVYRFEMEDDDPPVIAKLYRPGRWSRAALAEEHGFLAELEEDGIPVAAPLPLDGAPAETPTIGETHGLLYAVFPLIRGRAPQELGDGQIRTLGRLLARLHNVGTRTEAPHRPTLSPATYGRGNLELLLEHDLLPPEVRDVYAGTIDALLTRIEPMFLGVPNHRIHGDCHLANLVWTDDGPAFLDFDDMLVGPAVQDVWMLCPSYDEEGRRQRDVLVDAYVEHRDFDRAWLRLVEPLRALRFVHYATWIARRWSDPLFQRTFNEFGTLRYWQKEVNDLREQIARLDTAPEPAW